MDTNNFGAELQEIEKNIEVAQTEMETACNEFMKATEVFVTDWYQSIVKNGLTANASAALELGAEGLKKVKVELNDLTARLPELIEQYVNTDKWPHRNKLPEDSGRKFGISFVKELSNNYLHGYIQILLGHVGELLIKHGLADNSWDMKTDETLPSYNIACVWSEDMDSAMRKYADGCDKWITLDNERQKIEKQKTEAEISDLWDNL